MMGRVWGAAVLGLALLAAVHVYAGELSAECERLFLEGVRAYGELDYAHAEHLLEDAAAQCTYTDKVSKTLQANILEQLAFTKVALGKFADAEEVFLRLLLVDSKYTLDEQRTSPKILETFRRAKRRYDAIAPKPNQKPQPVLKKTVKPVSRSKQGLRQSDHLGRRRFEVALAAGGRMLFGNDMGNFGGGVDVRFDAYYALLDWLVIGGGVRYEFHPTSGLISGERLNLLAPMALVAVRKHVAPLKLRAGLLLGAAFYGLDSVSDATGVLYGGLAGLAVPLPSGFEPGMEVEIAQVSDTEGRHSTSAALLFRAAFCW